MLPLGSGIVLMYSAAARWRALRSRRESIPSATVPESPRSEGLVAALGRPILRGRGEHLLGDECVERRAHFSLRAPTHGRQGFRQEGDPEHGGVLQEGALAAR